MQWNNLIEEVLERKARGQKNNLLSGNDKSPSASRGKMKTKPALKKRTFVSCDSETGNSSIYFTPREIECLKLLLQYKTINDIAANLKLSPRTVEYYIKNMKTKAGCRTKLELLEKIYNSDFKHKINKL